jgi:NadR type nicotinamide-nucleotide adenylyltransferase
LVVATRDAQRGRRMTRAFILGKFMPPHAGHAFLFRTALELCQSLTILVCSTDGDEIDGALRADWTRAIEPRASVIHLHRDLPQSPEESPDFWPIWKAAIRETCGDGFTHVFASEPYVFRLAETLGAAPMLIDPAREAFPISASSIRAAPAAHWRFIPAPVRPFYQKRLTLIGPESVGKSTLAYRLPAKFQTLVAPEYGRAYDQYYKQGHDWRADDLAVLARTHVAMRRAIAGEAGPLLIEDTDAVQTAIWSLHLTGEIDPMLAMLERLSPADHYLLLSPDVAWTQDGVRYAGAEATRAFFFDEALRRLRALGASFDIIDGGDFDSRAERAFTLACRRFPEAAACIVQ